VLVVEDVAVVDVVGVVAEPDPAHSDTGTDVLELKAAGGKTVVTFTLATVPSGLHVSPLIVSPGLSARTVNRDGSDARALSAKMYAANVVAAPKQRLDAAKFLAFITHQLTGNW